MVDINEMVTKMVEGATRPNQDLLCASMRANTIFIVDSIYDKCPAVFKYEHIGTIDFVNDTDALIAGGAKIVLVGSEKPEWVGEATVKEECLPMGVNDLVIENDKVYRVSVKTITVWPQ